MFDMGEDEEMKDDEGEDTKWDSDDEEAKPGEVDTTRPKDFGREKPITAENYEARTREIPPQRLSSVAEKRSSDRSQANAWWCCTPHCHGTNLRKLHTYCPECEHRRCGACKDTILKQPRER